MSVCVHVHVHVCQYVCLTFSPVMAKGVLNHCSKVLTDLKMVGRRKFKRAHSSGKLFWNDATIAIEAHSHHCACA